MHGVKRLFSWMIPRFDPRGFNVALRRTEARRIMLDPL